jgi:hypothetical protein
MERFLFARMRNTMAFKISPSQLQRDIAHIGVHGQSRHARYQTNELLLCPLACFRQCYHRFDLVTGHEPFGLH